MFTNMQRFACNKLGHMRSVVWGSVMKYGKAFRIQKLFSTKHLHTISYIHLSLQNTKIKKYKTIILPFI
jgi:hypothetical protein